MLNSTPLNSGPLNALAGSADPTDPVIIDPPAKPSDPLPGDGVYPGFPVPPPPAGHSFRWSATVMLGGVNVSALLAGSVRVDREEGAAGIAEFGVFYPPGTPVQTDLSDRTVTVDYITDDGAGAVQVRLFTGFVAEPRWDALARVMHITATDNLQNRVESMSTEYIDSLTRGAWSEDVFNPIEGRSRWDYAQERMSTRTASLDCSPTGSIRVTSWYANATPNYTFGADTTAYQSINVDLAQLRNVTNRVELEIAYRYSRLHDANVKYKWSHPAGGFCTWRTLSTELPDINMAVNAVEGGSLVPVYATWTLLPQTSPDPCGTGVPWINNYAGLLLGFNVTSARRWTQSVTETYKLNLATAAGQIDGQQIISRTGVNVSVDHDDSDGWDSSLIPIVINPLYGIAESPPIVGYGVPGDRSDDERRFIMLNTMLQSALSEIVGSHRKTLVSWSVPASMALGVDLSDTVEINDQLTRARAKCSHRVDELNFETGSAMTSISISVMRGGGESDPLIVPDRIGDYSSVVVTGWGETEQLPTQIGGRFTSPVYNDEMDGFSGNYAAAQDSMLEVFPRRLALTAPEIDKQFIDELAHELERDYYVGVPNDLLEL